MLDKSILETLKSREKIDVGREGTVRSWEFDKITLDKNGLWILIVNFEGNFQNVEMVYDMSVILSPENYDMALRTNL